MLANDGIKEGIKVIEQVHNLNRLTEGRDGGETHNVTEVEWSVIEPLWLDWLPHLKGLGHRPERGREVCYGINLGIRNQSQPPNHKIGYVMHNGIV